jgi:hypothetical protein
MIEIEPDAADKGDPDHQKEPSHFSHKTRWLYLKGERIDPPLGRRCMTLRLLVKLLKPSIFRSVGRAMCQAIRAIFITYFRFLLTGLLDSQFRRIWMHICFAVFVPSG